MQYAFDPGAAKPGSWEHFCDPHAALGAGGIAPVRQLNDKLTGDECVEESAPDSLQGKIHEMNKGMDEEG